MLEIDRILALLERAAGQPAALATLVQVEGSSYRRPGARLVLLPDDTYVGSISGGCLEEDVRERARRVLATGRPELAIYDTTAENDLVWGVGLGCQGIVRILLERIPAERPAWVAQLAADRRSRRATTLFVDYAGESPGGTTLAAPVQGTAFFADALAAPPALVICGAGDDAQPLARLAKETGWHVTIVDARPAAATPARFPGADHLLAGPLAELGPQLPPADERTFVVIMTHRYADDLHWVGTWLPRPIAYLGQLGPRKRTERLLEEIGGATPEQRARLHAPVGLDLGGSQPEAVALAILAEMHARLAGRNGGFLRDRPGPIHG